MKKDNSIEESLIKAQTFVSRELGYDINVTIVPEKNAFAATDGKSIALGAEFIKSLKDDAQELYGNIIDIIGEYLGQKLTIDDIFNTTIELITAHELGHILRKHPPTAQAWLKFTDELAQSLYDQHVEKQELIPEDCRPFIQQARCRLSQQIREIDADTQAIKILTEIRDKPSILCAVMLNRFTSEKIATEEERTSSHNNPRWFFPQYHRDHPRDDIRLFSEMQVLNANHPLTESEQEVLQLIEQNAENGEHRFKLCYSKILNEEHRDIYEKIHECWKEMDSYIEANMPLL